MSSFEILSLEIYTNLKYYYKYPRTDIATLDTKVFDILSSVFYLNELKEKHKYKHLYNHILFFIDLYNRIKVTETKEQIYSVIKYYYIDNVDNPALFGNNDIILLLSMVCTNLIFLKLFIIKNCYFNINNNNIDKVKEMDDSKFIDFSQDQMYYIINELNPNITDYFSKKYM